MMIHYDKRNERPEAYPKPTETDRQMNQQDEFIEGVPHQKSDISSAPAGNRDEEEGQVRQPTQENTESIP